MRCYHRPTFGQNVNGHYKLTPSCDAAGWLCKIKLTNEDDIKGLMDAEAYKAHCEGKE